MSSNQAATIKEILNNYRHQGRGNTAINPMGIAIRGNGRKIYNMGRESNSMIMGIGLKESLCMVVSLDRGFIHLDMGARSMRDIFIMG